MDILRYSMKNAKLDALRNGFLALEVPGLAERRPSVRVGDKVYAKVAGDQHDYEGYAHFVERDRVGHV